MEGNDWNWTGTNRFKRDGTGLGGTGTDSLNRLDRIKLDWSTRRRSGLDWSGLSRTAFQKTEVDGNVPNWTGLSLAEFDFSRLHYTTLHYPRLNLKVPCRIVSSLHLARLICTELHCTFPNETNKDCTALHVNVIHWTTQDIFVQSWK